MYLNDLIEFLEERDPGTPVPLGFDNPHSYRGYYDELAFEPKENTTIGDMLACAKQAVGSTYGGYKGGEFTMDEYSPVWLAKRGRTGESIGPVLLRYMAGEVSPNAGVEGRQPQSNCDSEEAAVLPSPRTTG